MMKSFLTSFDFENLEDLCAEISRSSLNIPVSRNLAVLSRKLKIGSRIAPNRLAVQPMEGADAESDGSPGSLTFRRYTRFAGGGSGLIWMEATAVRPDARSNPRQLYINRQNAEKFAELVKAMRRTARKECGHEPVIILQLTHPGRYCRPDGILKPFIAVHSPALDRATGITGKYPVVTDEHLDSLQFSFAEAAILAAKSGFDGVDVKCCHRNLAAELLGSRTRKGKYGGSFENRTRFLMETIAQIKENAPGMLIACRISAYNPLPHPYGFGVNANKPGKPDLAEPIELAGLLKKKGVSILNISMDNIIPLQRSKKPFDVMSDSMAAGNEYPLTVIDRMMNITRKIRGAVPSLPVVGRGFSWFRQFMPNVASGAINNGTVDMAGIGRSALAYPEIATDIFSGKLEPVKCCITCSACMQIFRDGGKAGCAVRDSEIYGLEFRQRRMFSEDSLKAEARRCHDCRSATCTAGCPAHIDVPGFIKAYAEDNIEKAFHIIRRSNVLPEMCSHLCPTWLMCEGACIESALSQNPIRIKDLQYAVCWMARDRGLTALKIPAKSTGKSVAIVGAGPAGVSCAVKLLEAGHSAVIFERENSTGGTPQQIIRAGRISGVREEVDAVLRPSIQAGRLVIRYGCELGRNVTLKFLQDEFDAVLVATGLWKEHSLGKADGVIDALTFLKKVKTGDIKSVPARVAILTGGDSAMDTAVTARDLGARVLYLIYPGSLSDMHWHMDDGWFCNSGVNMLSLTRPKGYEVDKKGKLTGLKICRTEYCTPGKKGERNIRDIPGTSGLLNVDMVIEAMGLGIANDIKKALKGVQYTKHGLVRTSEEGSFASGLERVFVAGGLINGGASVVHCIVDGMKAAEEISYCLR